MKNFKRELLHMSHGIVLLKNMSSKTLGERERRSSISYVSAIGSIMYASLFTRPNVTYALSVTSIYQSNSSESHWTTVKNILKYLRMTKDLFLIYGEDNLKLKGYID